MSNPLLACLRRKEQRGSKPRCHLITHGAAEDVAARLSALVAPFATIAISDTWMPGGFDDTEEAQLHRAPRVLDPRISDQLRIWWLAAASSKAKSPNFDIASTCQIDGKRGLLLIEAKAHDEELAREACGRLLTPDSSQDRKISHQTIGAAIAAASAGLQRATSLPWQLSRDNCYQMSNRFAWAWKLTELGVPVVLVYLGFLRATEMADRGRPFATHDEWQSLVLEHSVPLFPAKVWGRRWDVHGQALIPLIKSLEQPLGACE
jgi:hypothetical protein